MKTRKKPKSSRFKKELKRQTRYAIAAAIGFTIAFAWRDYILNLTSSFLVDMAMVMPNMSRFLGAILITLVGVILILLSSRLLE